MFSFAQNECLKSEDLLNMLKNSNDIYKTIEELKFFCIDSKDCYYNKKLKEKLLPLINRTNFFKYQYKINWNEEYSKSEILKFLQKRHKENLFDSIISDASLYNSYLDSVKMECNKKNFEYYLSKPWLPNNVIKILTSIKWKEVYDIFYLDWLNDGKSITSYCFKALLSMHCPEAINLYNSIIDKAIILEKIDFLKKVKQDAFNFQYYGSYCVDLYINLLRVKTMYIPNRIILDENIEYTKIPFNYELVSEKINPICEIRNLDNFQFENLKDSIYDINNEKKIYSELIYKKISNEIIQFIQDFENQAQNLKNYYNNQEFYWKQNLPYYNNKNK